MYYYKKENEEIVKYDVTVDESKLFEYFGIWGQSLNPSVFTHVVSLLNGNYDVIQELLDSEDMSNHNFPSCFTLEEIDRMPIDKYRRIINFFGLKDVPVKVNGIENATSKSRDYYDNSDNSFTRKHIQLSFERIREIIEHFYLRYGDKCPNVVALLETLEKGDFSVVPEILLLVKDKVKEAREMDGDKTNALRDLRFLYQPISNAIRTKEVVSITGDEYIAGTKFFDIDFPLDLVPVCPDQLLDPEYLGLLGEELIECMLDTAKEEPSADRLLEILNGLEFAQRSNNKPMISYWLRILNRLPEEAKRDIQRIQNLQDQILTARSQSNESEEAKLQAELDSFLESKRSKTK